MYYDAPHRENKVRLKLNLYGTTHKPYYDTPERKGTDHTDRYHSSSGVAIIATYRISSIICRDSLFKRRLLWQAVDQRLTTKKISLYDSRHNTMKPKNVERYFRL